MLAINNWLTFFFTAYKLDFEFAFGFSLQAGSNGVKECFKIFDTLRPGLFQAQGIGLANCLFDRRQHAQGFGCQFEDMRAPVIRVAFPNNAVFTFQVVEHTYDGRFVHIQFVGQNRLV